MHHCWSVCSKLHCKIVISPARIMQRVPTHPFNVRRGRPCSSYRLCVLLSAAPYRVRCSITHCQGHCYGALGCCLRRLLLRLLKSTSFSITLPPPQSMIGKCNEHFDHRREAAASDEQQLRTPEDGRIAQLTTETLVTRINSLLYIEENLPAMEKIVQDRSACISCPLCMHVIC